jgi:tetratricopeptide (TPR) repeat protein
VTRLAGGERQKAVGDLEAAVALKPTDTRADSYLIMALIAHNDTDKALQAAQALEEKQPKEPITRLLKGAVYLAKQDMPQARASFESALKLRPSYFPAAAALAQLDLRDKNPDAARGRMEAILKHDKSNLDAMLTLANMEFDAGRPSVAISWVRRAQNEHPQATQPYLMLAQVQLEAGDAKEALSAARQARDMNPADPRALEILARAQLAAAIRAQR